METVKRILAAIVMTVSLLVLMLSLAGIAGIWIVRGELVSDLVGVVTAAETGTTLAKQGLDRLDTVLTQAHSQVAAVEQDVEAFGADVERSKPLLTAISDKLGLNLTPLVDSAREIRTTIREAAVALNATIEAVNAIPFVSVPVPELESLNKLSQDVENFGTEVQNLHAAIDQRRSEIIQGTVSIITTPTSQIRSTLDEMQGTVSDYGQQLGAAQERLSSLKSAIQRRLTWTAVSLTLILLWLGFSQSVLFVLGGRVVSGWTLVPRGRREPPTIS